MSLTNELFSIGQITHENGAVSVMLSINPESDILKGHFPGHPVVPGASMLQIVKEVLENILQIELRLKKADHLKFMSLIDPSTITQVQLDIKYLLEEDQTVFVTAKLSEGERVCFKLQGAFVKQ